MSSGVVDIFILPQNAILKAVAAAEGKRTRFIACQFIAASNFVDFVVEGSDGLAIFADSILQSIVLSLNLTATLFCLANAFA